MENFSSIDNSNLLPDNSSSLKRYKKFVFFCTAGIIIFLVLFYSLFFGAPKNFPVNQTINITQGSSLRSLSKELKKENIIRSRVAFEAFIIIYGGEKHIAPGDYIFESKLPVFEIARRISNRDHHLTTIKITIPEGFDVSEMADVFSAKLKNFNKDSFLMEAKGDEGYLFPDTYFFFSTADENDVLNYLKDNFVKKITSLKPQIISSSKTENAIITMASLIEREAKGDADRGIISGILWNRIAKKMPLQIDAAPETYKIKGLPKNPICNPGLEAIFASIHPVNSPYLYYLHDKDGMIHYARTFVEHKKNIAKYLK